MGPIQSFERLLRTELRGFFGEEDILPQDCSLSSYLNTFCGIALQILDLPAPQSHKPRSWNKSLHRSGSMPLFMCPTSLSLETPDGYRAPGENLGPGSVGGAGEEDQPFPFFPSLRQPQRHFQSSDVPGMIIAARPWCLHGRAEICKSRLYWGKH